MKYENAFTKEELDDMLKDDVCSYSNGTVRELARSLLAEMEKPKVWDGAPEWATVAYVTWDSLNHKQVFSKQYIRETTKTREREIAEEKEKEYSYKNSDSGVGLVDLIESAILKAKAEWEAGK